MWFSLDHAIIIFIIAIRVLNKWSKYMTVSYNKLWKILIDRKLTRTELKDMAGISFNVLAKLGRDEFVSMESLMKICATLNCNIGDIMDFLPESDGLEKI